MHLPEYYHLLCFAVDSFVAAALPLNSHYSFRMPVYNHSFPFNALTLLVAEQEGHLACNKLGVGLLVVMI